MGISRKDIQEIKALPNPPVIIKIAVESICVLLGEPDLSWRALRGTVMRENFISQIVNFDTECLT